MIKESGFPNYLSCRIPVVSNLKCQNWAKYLDKYWDKQLLDLLQYRFHLNFNRQTDLISTEENHALAVQNSTRYITLLKN